MQIVKVSVLKVIFGSKKTEYVEPIQGSKIKVLFGLSKTNILIKEK
jgi:hypothetical protein